MLVQVYLEGVAFPLPHGLDNFKWDAPKQVFKGATDTEAMSFEVGEIVPCGDTFYALDEVVLGEWGGCLPVANFVHQQNPKNLKCT